MENFFEPNSPVDWRPSQYKCVQHWGGQVKVLRNKGTTHRGLSCRVRPALGPEQHQRAALGAVAGLSACACQGCACSASVRSAWSCCTTGTALSGQRPAPAGTDSCNSGECTQPLLVCRQRTQCLQTAASAPAPPLLRRITRENSLAVNDHRIFKMWRDGRVWLRRAHTHEDLQRLVARAASLQPSTHLNSPSLQAPSVTTPTRGSTRTATSPCSRSQCHGWDGGWGERHPVVVMGCACATVSCAQPSVMLSLHGNPPVCLHSSSQPHVGLVLCATQGEGCAQRHEGRALGQRARVT